MRSFRVCVAVLMLAGALVSAGCGAVSEKVGEEIGEEIAGGVVGADIEVEGDSVTVETEDGSVTMSGTEGTLPEGMPSDVPVYEDADVDSSSTFSGDESTDYYVNLYVADSVKDVYDWYKAELAAEGWTVNSDLFMADSGDDSALLAATKGSAQISISLDAEDDRTALTLVVVVGK